MQIKVMDELVVELYIEFPNEVYILAWLEARVAGTSMMSGTKVAER